MKLRTRWLQIVLVVVIGGFVASVILFLFLRICDKESLNRYNIHSAL